MIPKQAIEKAIEGGWLEANQPWLQQHLMSDSYHIALDPSFWQALGKALGKENHMEALAHDWDVPWWRGQALNFYDLILTGDDTEKFWADLLQ
jgi:hypothetical protein